MIIIIVTSCNLDGAHSGEAVRVIGLAKGLAANGASVFLLHRGRSADGNDVKLVHYEGLVSDNAANKYLSPFNWKLPVKLKEILKQSDACILQIEQPYCLTSLRRLAEKAKLDIVVDEHNVELVASLKPNTVCLSPYVFFIERMAVHAAKQVLAVSENDAQILSRLYGISNEKILVIPNCVDFSMFGKKDKDALREKLGFDPNAKLVLFHGLLSWYPNYEATQLVTNFIAPRIQEAQFLIIGKGLPDRLSRTAVSLKNVEVLGYVANIEDYISASDICIVPLLRGSGTRLKVLEYMAAGKPIVSTYKGVEGLSVKNRIHGLFFHDVDKAFVEGVRSLLDDEDLCQILGSNSRELAREFDWTKVAAELYASYRNLVT